MFKCVNCEHEIDDDAQVCYFCGNDPFEKVNDENVIVYENVLVQDQESMNVNLGGRQEQNYKVANGKEANFDYFVHGANPIFEIRGNRGRRLYVYEHKCVIKVDVTLGSVLTHNATDGEKTIYYKDVIGVQLKKEGLLIGYLQLETASEKGNNKSSNFFDENTFTFDKYEDVYLAYKYILSRLDEIKRI